MPILLYIKYFKGGTVLNHPNIISLLGGLTCSIDGVNADVLVVFSLPGVNDNDDMHIEFDADISQLGHEGVLQFEFLKPFCLLR